MLSFFVLVFKSDASYLWEMQTEEGRSCCLHFGYIDICNPYVACSGFAKKDLSGILDYVLRVLNSEQAQQDPYNTVLLQVKKYIRSILHNPYGTLEYHHENRSVKFYHDLLASAAMNKTKESKKEVKQTAKSKNQKDDVVIQYLIKLGLFVKHEK